MGGDDNDDAAAEEDEGKEGGRRLGGKPALINGAVKMTNDAHKHAAREIDALFLSLFV